MAKAGIGPVINKGHIYTMIVAIVVGACDATYNHFWPTQAAQHASEASDAAVQKAADAASKEAVIETKVAEHTAELGEIMVTMGDMKTDVAVLKSQGSDTKQALSSQSDKMDRLLMAVSRMQGASRSPSQCQ
jgi:hypothetical protein